MGRVAAEMRGRPMLPVALAGRKACSGRVLPQIRDLPLRVAVACPLTALAIGARWRGGFGKVENRSYPLRLRAASLFASLPWRLVCRRLSKSAISLRFPGHVRQIGMSLKCVARLACRPCSRWLGSRGKKIGSAIQVAEAGGAR